jgi:transposase InsO family protein
MFCDPSTPELQSTAYLTCDVTVPPLSSIEVPLRVAAIEQRTMMPGTVLLHGAESLSEKTNLNLWTSALVTAQGDGGVIGGIMNYTENAVTLKRGTKYGSATAVGGPAEYMAGLAALCVIEGREEHSVAQHKSWPMAQKQKWIRETFHIKDCVCLTTDQDRQRAVDLLLEFWDVLSIDGDFGETDLIEHRIYTEDRPPIKERVRPINPKMEANLKEQVDAWKKHDVVEPTNSPWNFALVAAPKKGNKIRWCVDYRKLNDITLKDAFPLPSIEDNLARLSNSKVFSGVDGAGAYHVVPIHAADRAKTAFATPWGAFCFKRMPFGLTNAPATYARLVQMTLHGIALDKAIPYLDDTCIHSKDVSSHFSCLREVFTAFRKAGLKLQPSKCKLFREEIEYLGHLVSAKGILPLPDYISIVKDWPLPTSKTQARAFLGKVGYYRKFVKGYSSLARPWTDVTGSGDPVEEKKPLVVTSEMKDSFRIMRKALITAPILAYPQFDSKEPFIVDTDWSQIHNCIGAVLSQKQGGHERVISYGAKKLTEAAKRYPPQQGELAAVIFFLGFWSYYLKFRRFTLRTDHQSLKWIHSMSPPSPMLQRWLAVLADYDFEVQYRKGSLHGNADALSRTDHATAIEDPDYFLNALTQWHDDSLILAPIWPAKPDWTATFLRQQQEEDPDLKIIAEWVKKQHFTPTKEEKTPLSHLGQSYSGLLPYLRRDSEGVLRTMDAAGKSKLCLPRELWDTAIKYTHEVGGHMGQTSTFDRLKKYIYFPGMKREVDSFVRGCKDCVAKWPQPTHQKHTLVSQPVGFPFQRVCMDFVGPMTTSNRGHKYILTVQCSFTRWLEAFPCRSATADIVAKILEKDIFCRFGIPEKLHSDQGTQFTSRLMKEVGQQLGIQITTTPTYNPRSNPVERSHRTIGMSLRALLQQRKVKDWDLALACTTFAMNTTINRSTGYSPYQLMFGREASQPLDLLFGAPTPPTDAGDADHQQYVKKLRDRLEHAAAAARSNVGAAVARNRRQYHQERNLLQPGQQVWLFTPVAKADLSRKLTNFWSGPWEIIEQKSPVLYIIQPHPSWPTHKTEVCVSIDRLRLYRPPTAQGQAPLNLPPTNPNITLDNDPFVESWNLEDEETSKQGKVMEFFDATGGGGGGGTGGNGGSDDGTSEGTSADFGTPYGTPAWGWEDNLDEAMEEDDANEVRAARETTPDQPFATPTAPSAPPPPKVMGRRRKARFEEEETPPEFHSPTAVTQEAETAEAVDEPTYGQTNSRFMKRLRALVPPDSPLREEATGDVRLEEKKKKALRKVQKAIGKDITMDEMEALVQVSARPKRERKQTQRYQAEAAKIPFKETAAQRFKRVHAKFAAPEKYAAVEEEEVDVEEEDDDMGFGLFG